MKRYIVAVVAVLLGVLGASGQQRNVIAGLEGNTEYRTLIEEEGALVRTSDSLATEIAALRRTLRTDTLDRAATSAAIVRMEEAGFEIRSRMARLASRINTIEQEWILASLVSQQPPTEEAPGNDNATQRHSPNLVYSSWFENGLSAEQLAELHAAQQAESDIPRLAEQYRRDHTLLAVLAREYDLALSQPTADSIRAEFDAVRSSERATAEDIGTQWGAIFDSKSYLYNLLADKENRSTLLARFEGGMERLREEQPRWHDIGAPAPLLDYVTQKRMLTDFEIALAGELGNAPATDSLRGVLASLPGPMSLADLGPVTLKERLFLDYADVQIGGSPYNASTPIPEVAVWPRGVIWRVQVGNFSARQSPSIFRGAHPLAFGQGDDGRFRYFAGGFSTDSLAVTAVEGLRKAGFRAPTAVVWMDGVFIDPAAEGTEKPYRIEISGLGELPPEVREAVATESESDIVRAAGNFIISPLDGAAAIRLRTLLETLRASHAEMEVSLSKIPE